MSADFVTELQDDDAVLIFRRMSATGDRRRSTRMLGSDLRKAILASKVLRVERATGVVVGNAGQAIVQFSKPFLVPPLGSVVPGWANRQMIVGSVTKTTETSATVTVMQSVATVIIGASPFGIAPAGTPVIIDLFGF